MNHKEMERIKENYNSLPEGSNLIRAAIENGIKVADEEKNYDWMLQFRYDYIREYTFNDDAFKAILMFPELISIFDKHEGELEWYNGKNLLWAYKWLLVDAADFYQISLKQIEAYFEDFKQRCLRYGYSLRVYYQKYAGFLEEIDLERFKEIAYKYLEYNRDNLSDCEACELNTYVRREMLYGDFQKGMNLVKPIFDGRKSCSEVPSSTYDNFLIYYLEKGDKENCDLYEKKLYKSMEINNKKLSEMGTILKYCAMYDIEKGIRRFKKFHEFYLKAKNPKYIFEFSIGAYELFLKVKESRKKETITLLLDKKFPIYKEDGVYAVDDLMHLFENKCIEIGQKLDTRNGNNYLMERLRKIKI